MMKLNKKSIIYLIVTLLIIMGTGVASAEILDYDYGQDDIIQERDDGTYIKIDDDGTYQKLDFNRSYLKLDGEVEVDPFAVDACPGWGRHDMVSAGWATLVKVNNNGSRERIFTNGASWQCSRCKEVVATQYDPLQAKYVGYYAMRNPGYWIPASIIMDVSSNGIQFTSGSKVPHCILRYK